MQSRIGAPSGSGLTRHLVCSPSWMLHPPSHPWGVPTPLWLLSQAVHSGIEPVLSLFGPTSGFSPSQSHRGDHNLFFSSYNHEISSCPPVVITIIPPSPCRFSPQSSANTSELGLARDYCALTHRAARIIAFPNHFSRPLSIGDTKRTVVTDETDFFFFLFLQTVEQCLQESSKVREEESLASKRGTFPGCPLTPKIQLVSAFSTLDEAGIVHYQGQTLKTDRNFFVFVFCQICSWRARPKAKCVIVWIAMKFILWKRKVWTHDFCRNSARKSTRTWSGTAEVTVQNSKNGRI